MNLPWGVDSYSVSLPEHFSSTKSDINLLQPLDLTLLDQHFGDIKQWQATIDEIHRREMFVILDHTFST
jgi:alpha-1,3-glucan synthase